MIDWRGGDAWRCGWCGRALRGTWRAHLDTCREAWQARQRAATTTAPAADAEVKP
jgi:hypothetical protein